MTQERDEEYEAFDVVELEDVDMVLLGRQGENQTQSVVIDCSEWLDDYPGAQLYIVALRPKEEQLYTPIVTVDNGVITWEILAQDTAYAGFGRAEVRCILDDKVKKSAVFVTKIEPSIEGDGEDVITPPAWALQILQAVEDARNAAQASARSAADAADSALAAENSASDAGDSASAAAGTASQLRALWDEIGLGVDAEGYVTQDVDDEDE